MVSCLCTLNAKMSVTFSFSFPHSTDVLLISVPFLSTSLNSSFRTAGVLKYKRSVSEVECVCVYVSIYTHTHTNLKCTNQSSERIYTLHGQAGLLSINTMYLWLRKTFNIGLCCY